MTLALKYRFIYWRTTKNMPVPPTGRCVVKFTAEWCGPCRAIKPKLADLQTRYHQIAFVEVDVDEEHEVMRKHGVDAMPTFLFLNDGEEVVPRVVGADEKAVARAVDCLDAANQFSLPISTSATIECRPPT